MRVLSLLALAAPLVSAIQFLEPTSNSTLQKGETYSVKWDFVDTDPTTFSIYLVNFVDWPPFYTQVASDVQTTDGEYDVTVPCDVDSSWGFQFNAINGTNVYVIHAQTDEFYISNGVCSGTKPTSAVPICSTATVTVTETAVSTVTEAATCPTLSATTTVALPSASGSFPAGSSPSDVPDDEPTKTAAPPVVTSPASLDDAEDDEDEDVTSTVYTTVYKDLSEVHECGPCEA